MRPHQLCLAFVCTLGMLLGGHAANAASDKPFEIPALTSPVIDQAGIMSPQGKARVEQLVRGVFESGGSQITVLTVASLGDSAIEEAAIKVFDQWKLGHEKKDDGILFLVAPNERRMRIEVGRGREGEVPDAIANRIIKQVVGPAFLEGQYDQGIVLGVAAIIQRSDPTFDLEKAGAPRPRIRSRPQASLAHYILVAIFLMISLFRGVTSGFGGSRYGRMSGGGWSGGGGGWSGGGGGGGGWSGGGGGSSGGGSSGSW